MTVVARRGKIRNTFNSLSRDHEEVDKTLRALEATTFQLPLSGSRLVHQLRERHEVVLSTPSLGITALKENKITAIQSGEAFNSLSRDHFAKRIIYMDARDKTFNSLSRDHAFTGVAYSRWQLLSTPSLGITSRNSSAACSNVISPFNSLSRDHISGMGHEVGGSCGELSTPSLGITCQAARAL